MSYYELMFCAGGVLLISAAAYHFYWARERKKDSQAMNRVMDLIEPNSRIEYWSDERGWTWRVIYEYPKEDVVLETPMLRYLNQYEAINAAKRFARTRSPDWKRVQGSTR